MIPLTLTEVAAVTGGSLGRTDARDAVVTSAVIDSRAATGGTLFVALAGEHVDGHDYVEAAAALGAVAALTARELPDAPIPCVVVPDVPAALAALARETLARLRERPAGERPVVVGITGSVGKTSTKDLLSVMLTPLGAVVAPVASFNNEIGLPLTVLRADESTRALVLEMGADAPGNLTFLTGIAPPDVAVELIVGHAHLQGFGSIEGVARAKAELVQGLAPGGVAVLNADDVRVRAMAALADRVLTFGRAADADVRAEEVVLGADGHAELTLVAAGERRRVRLALAGAHHVTNALAAAAVALHLGRPLAEVADGLASTGAISPHRMQITDAGGIRVVDDSYNANLTSMRAALDALAAMSGPGRRSVAVLGEMRELGAEALGDHTAVGEHAAVLGIDEVVVVGAGAAAIADALEAAGRPVHRVEGVDDAQALLASLLAPGDVVLVKASNGAGLTRLGDALAAGSARVDA